MFFRQNEDGLFLIMHDKIYLLDSKDFKIIEFYNNENGSIYTLKFWKKNHLLYNNGPNITIFNTTTKKFQYITYPHQNLGYGFAIYQDYMIISESGQSSLFDLETGKIFKTIKSKSEGTKFCIDVIDDAVLSGFFGCITYLNLITGNLEKFEYEKAVIFDLYANQNNKTLVYGSFNGDVGVVDFLTKEKIYSFKLSAIVSIQNIECFDDIFCFKSGSNPCLCYGKDNLQKFEDFEFCSFLNDGDLLLGNINGTNFNFKKVSLGRGIKQLQKIKFMKNYDIYFHSK